MIGILAFWESKEENRYSGSKWDLLLWSDTLGPLGADFFILIDEANLKPKFTHHKIKFETFSSLEEALNRHRDKRIVLLEAERNIPVGTKYSYLKEFQHPKENVLYVIGPDTGCLDIQKLEKEKLFTDLVAIETEENFTLWSFIVAGIVLYDRRLKLGCYDN